ncbi:hypothetical protein [Kitasatospora purpeofusca]|uniref:hypothetical protein n=1 Tax=Kitasatospora purpeofusca TaxID=67352 RepID=UPI002A5A646C|nr:hypothetical protein [Kitasatospora purpeofusca]MDY0813380.1 hypothetical protein [Kitasatospora purpeofusca]
MANNESATPVSTEPAAEAVTAEAGQAVEGAVAAAPSAVFEEPTAEERAELESETFGDESDYVVEPHAPAAGEPGKGGREPQGVIWSHP